MKLLFHLHHFDLDDLRNANLALKSNLRENVKVIIIDDDEFVYLNELRKLHFNVTHVTDIEDLYSVEAYPIVICDIRGVGKKIGSSNEGAYVVNQLQKNYPFKQYAVYTGSSYNTELTSMLKDVSIIKKDVDIEQWAAYIDEFIKRVTNPIETWKTIRYYLLSKDVSLLSVLKMEEVYVKTVLKCPEQLRNFPDVNSFPEINNDIRGVVQSLVAGVMLSLAGL